MGIVSKHWKTLVNLVYLGMFVTSHKCSHLSAEPTLNIVARLGINSIILQLYFQQCHFTLQYSYIATKITFFFVGDDK